MKRPARVTGMRLALFDLDNTLVSRRTALSNAITDLCNDCGYGTDVEEWLRTQLAERANVDDFVRLVARFRLSDDVAQLWRRYVDRMTASITCRPEVLNGLDGMRTAGWTIGIVTNGAGDIQRAKLAATGLDRLINGLAVSGDVEIRKPDRRLFELAASRCGANLADGGWMVGDSPTGDIGGGHQAGLRTIWLRGRPWPEDLPAADHVVNDVTDAIAILQTETE